MPQMSITVKDNSECSDCRMPSKLYRYLQKKKAHCLKFKIVFKYGVNENAMTTNGCNTLISDLKSEEKEK